MPGWKSASDYSLRWRCRGRCRIKALRAETLWTQSLFGILLLLSLCAWVPAQADMVVHHAALEKQGKEYLLNANIEISFAQALVEALHQGVGITLELRLILKEQRDYLWDRQVATLSRRDTVRYHRLAGLYQLDIQLDGKLVEPWTLDVPRYHKTLHAALAAIGSIRDLPFVIGERHADRKYNLSLQARLVVDALPLGLIPEALTSPDWQMETEEISLEWTP